jgi:diguanylate cyclase (GGDEF)-like protein/PAS domain S-box-containing protein
MIVSGMICGDSVLLVMRDFSCLRRQLREKVALARTKTVLEIEKKRLENESLDLQRQIARTLDSLVDPLAIIRPLLDKRGLATDWVVDYANPAACAYWKVDNWAGGKSIRDFISTQHILPMLAWCRDVLSTGEALSVNDYAYGESIFGEERRFDVRISRVDGCLSWTWRDVTERFKAAGKIAESEERYRLLAQNSSDVVVLADKNKIVRWASPSVKEVLGWDLQDWIGRPCSEFLASKEEIADFERHSSSVSKNGLPERFRQQIKSKNGTVHWVEAHTGPYIGAGDGTSGTVTSFRTVDEQVRMEEELSRLARVDELTKLLNRREGLTQLEKLQTQVDRTGETLAVLFVDFDNFKLVNDTYGHLAGDLILRTMGKRIHACLRTSDDVGARVGGDEMLVVLRGVRGLEDAIEVAEKLRLKASIPFPFQGAQIRTTVSVGVALASIGEPPKALIGRADEAMYQAKLAGRDQVVTIPADSSVGENSINGLHSLSQGGET